MTKLAKDDQSIEKKNRDASRQINAKIPMLFAKKFGNILGASLAAIHHVHLAEAPPATTRNSIKLAKAPLTVATHRGHLGEAPLVVVTYHGHLAKAPLTATIDFDFLKKAPLAASRNASKFPKTPPPPMKSRLDVVRSCLFSRGCKRVSSLISIEKRP